MSKSCRHAQFSKFKLLFAKKYKFNGSTFYKEYQNLVIKKMPKILKIVEKVKKVFEHMRSIKYYSNLKINLKICQKDQSWVSGWMDGWMGDGWMGGWMEIKAGLRITYSYQKCFKLLFS